MFIKDKYLARKIQLADPAVRDFAITPHNTEDLPLVPRAIWVGTGGDLQVLLANSDEPVVYRNVPDGTWMPLRAIRVLATGTTAEDLVGVL